VHALDTFFIGYFGWTLCNNLADASHGRFRKAGFDGYETWRGMLCRIDPGKAAIRLLK
jgi:hypothetical protein